MTALDAIPHVPTMIQMENQDRAQQTGPELRDLYPTLSEDELREAVENLHRE
jgi:hypothetical protein